MPSAIILVNTSIGMENQVLKSLKGHEGVLEVFSVQGAYDIIVKVKTDTFASLRETIDKIKRTLPKIQSTVTMLVVERSHIPLEAANQ